jgi:CheY-like chemotaxis protein
LFGDKERLISGGCTDYLAKPFTKEDILTVLKKSLGIRE